MDGSNKKYYNRETSIPYSCDGDIIKEAKILSLSKINDKNNEPLDKGQLPEGAKLLAVGLTLDDFDVPALKSLNGYIHDRLALIICNRKALQLPDISL
mmetsp:Transcript_20032/g.28373  ORF Transcript_20032/g.28373 Transcript_20032/m.28373 type:complete len:98 (+) Transcript_20032:330-623(+)